MEGSASPRKPRVAMDNRSLTSESLLVAWRSKARRASSRIIPLPLSPSRISLRPPASISRRNSVAPASSEFSRSSLTTLAGRSTTSPAAILLATLSERMRMRPISKASAGPLLSPPYRHSHGSDLDQFFRRSQLQEEHPDEGGPKLRHQPADGCGDVPVQVRFGHQV